MLGNAADIGRTRQGERRVYFSFCWLICPFGWPLIFFLYGFLKRRESTVATNIIIIEYIDGRAIKCRFVVFEPSTNLDLWSTHFIFVAFNLTADWAEPFHRKCFSRIGYVHAFFSFLSYSCSCRSPVVWYTFVSFEYIALHQIIMTMLAICYRPILCRVYSISGKCNLWSFEYFILTFLINLSYIYNIPEVDRLLTKFLLDVFTAYSDCWLGPPSTAFTLLMSKEIILKET